MTFVPSLDMTKKYRLENNLKIEDKRGYNMPDFGQFRRMVVDRYTAAYGEPKIEVEKYAKELSNFKCFSCGLPLFDSETGVRVNEAHFDHIRPAANFNLYCKGNAAIMCRHCNTSKGSKDMRDFYNERVEKGLPVFFSKDELNVILNNEFNLYRKNHQKIADFGERMRLNLVSSDEIISFFYDEILSKVTFFKEEGQDIIWSKRLSDLHVDSDFWSSIRSTLTSDGMISTINKVERIFTMTNKSIFLYNEFELVEAINEVRALVEFEVKQATGLSQIIMEMLIKLDRVEVGKLLSKPVIEESVTNEWWEDILSTVNGSMEQAIIRDIKHRFDLIGRNILTLSPKASAYIIDEVYVDRLNKTQDKALLDRTIKNFFKITELKEIEGEMKYFTSNECNHRDNDFFNELISNMNNSNNEASMRKIKKYFTQDEGISIFTTPPTQFLSDLITLTEDMDNKGSIIVPLLNAINNTELKVLALNSIDSTWAFKLHPNYAYWKTVYDMSPISMTMTEVMNLSKHFISNGLTVDSLASALKFEIENNGMSKPNARTLSKIISSDLNVSPAEIVYIYDDKPISFTYEELLPIISEDDKWLWTEYLEERDNLESKQMMNIIVRMMYLNNIASVTSMGKDELHELIDYPNTRLKLRTEVNYIVNNYLS